MLQIRARGFVPFARAVAEQCAPRDPIRCANRIPVQFDAAGQAQFQYLVTDAFLAPEPVPGGCRAGAPCSIAVRALQGRDRGSIETVFVDAVPPPGLIEVTPARDLSLDGQVVTVVVHDYPPGARVAAMLCGAPDAIGARVVDPGRSRVSWSVRTDPAERRCGSRRVGSGRSVSDASAGTTAVCRSRPTSCSPAPRSCPSRSPLRPARAYDATRLGVGLGVAFLLLLLASVLLRRTDWSAVGEAAAPEIDDADYADLDAIIAALPPEAEETELQSSRN